jgi:sterol 3beta-glucosyltransferase
MRLALKMSPLRWWWVLAGLLHLSTLVGRAAGPCAAAIDAEAAMPGSGAAALGVCASAFFFGPSSPSSPSSSSIPPSLLSLLGSLWLDVAPLLLLVLAGYSQLMCSAADFQGDQVRRFHATGAHAAGAHRVGGAHGAAGSAGALLRGGQDGANGRPRAAMPNAWMWHPAQVGESSAQRAPVRILSQQPRKGDGASPLAAAAQGFAVTGKKSALRAIHQAATAPGDGGVTVGDIAAAAASAAAAAALSGVGGGDGSLSPTSASSAASSSAGPLWDAVLSNPSALPATFRRPLRIVILSVGTRGDVQPFVVLGVHLKEAGHSVAIATSHNFERMIVAAGLEFLPTGIDQIGQPESWVKVTSTADFIRATGPLLIKDFGTVSDHFYRGVAGPVRADLVLGTAMTVSFALNLSESLGIPCWVAKLAPELPSAGFVTPGSSVSSVGILNLLRCYLYWGQVASAAGSVGLTEAEDRWRTSTGGIGKVDPMTRIADMTYTPQLLGFSQFLCPKPTDYPQWAFQCGFWTTADMTESRTLAASVPLPLREWLELGKDTRGEPGSLGSRPIAVVTFGSMTNVPARPTILADITELLLERNFRVLVLTGWKGGVPAGLERFAADPVASAVAGAGVAAAAPDPRVLLWDEAPHEWLFRRISLVVHHGGAGTTARALACGIPSVIIPVLRWADQVQWGQLVEGAGVGALVIEANPTKQSIADALAKVQKPSAKDHVSMPERADILGGLVRAETSSDTALALLESCLCNMALPPALADAIHPLRGPVPEWSTLTKEQRMCVRHCIPCRRLRAEAGVVLPSPSQVEAVAAAAIAEATAADREARAEAAVAAAAVAPTKGAGAVRIEETGTRARAGGGGRRRAQS